MNLGGGSGFAHNLSHQAKPSAQPVATVDSDPSGSGIFDSRNGRFEQADRASVKSWFAAND
jgi:hypothetical protein